MTANLKTAPPKTPAPESAQEHDREQRITADGAEYAIYIHHAANDDRTGSWERAATTACPRTALNEAQKLYRSRKYAKVEVKRRRLNRKNNTLRGETLVVLGSRPSETPRKTIYRTACLGMALSAAALLLTLIAAG